MSRRTFSRELVAAVTLSVTLHAVWLVREAKASHASAESVSEVTLENLTPRAKFEEPNPEVTPPNAVNAPAPPVSRNTSAKVAPAIGKAVPAAAQAGKTLTAPDDHADDQLADFTLVEGAGATFVGGTTSSIGTSKQAVHGPATDQKSDTPRVKDPTAVGSGVNRARSATPVAPAWDCSRLFPADADAGDYASVLIAVSVDPNGKATGVAVLRDPGHGFGAAAIQCAKGQRFNAALDTVGNPIAATTPPINVRFSR